MSAQQVLADNNFGDTLPQGQAGPLGLLIVILLGIGTWLLVKSMNRHLKRIPASFDDPPPPHRPAAERAADVPAPTSPPTVGRPAPSPERPDPPTEP